MGVQTTHYVVLGVAIDNPAEVKKFFETQENNLAFIDGYHDNGYKTEITPTESGLHIIVDGMNGEYVVVGKILDKGLSENGMDFNQLVLEPDIPFSKEILKIDKVLGTNFQNLPLRYFVFTHWH